MGKTKRKRCSNQRFDPTAKIEGLQQQRVSGDAVIPALSKLGDPSPVERTWACLSLARLVTEESDQAVVRLIKGGLIHQTTLLLSDSSWEVREAATGTLRNISICSHGVHCQQLAHQRVTSPLLVLMQQCVEELVGGSSKDQHIASTLQQVLHLVLNVSQMSTKLVDLCSDEKFVDLLLQVFSNSSYFSLSLKTVAAQCLHTISEENSALAQLVCLSSNRLSILSSALCSSHYSPSTDMLTASIAGVLVNMLPWLPDHQQAVSLVSNGLSHVLGSDHVNMMLQSLAQLTQTDKQDQFTSISEQREKLVDSLAAIQVALEVLANLWCEDEEDEMEEEILEEEEEEEEENELEEKMEEDYGEKAVSNGLQNETTVATLRDCSWPLLSKVLYWCQLDKAKLTEMCQSISSGGDIRESLECVQEHAVVVVMNMLSVLPVRSWGEKEGIRAIWETATSILVTNSDEVSLQVCPEETMKAALSVITLIAEGLLAAAAPLISDDQLQILARIGRQAKSDVVRTAGIRALSAIGKIALTLSSKVIPLTFIGETLKQCLSQDTSVVVMCQAMDGLYDVLGDEQCPSDVLAASGDILQVLTAARAGIKAKLRKQKQLGPNYVLINTVKSNLPRFTDYIRAQLKK